MKKVLSICTMLAAASLLMAQHVVLTERSHGLGTDKVNDMKLASWIEPGPAGEGQVWDLRAMEAEKDFHGFTTDAIEADLNNDFPGANIVLNEEGNQFFFTQDENALSAWGMMTKSGKVLMQFNSPYLKMKYPFRYGDAFSGSYDGTYFLSNSEAPLSGSYSVKADGSGKLILPGNQVFEHTLRVESKRSYDVLIGDQAQAYEMTTYRWYTAGERFPLAVLISTSSTACGQGNISYRAAYKLVSKDQNPGKSALALSHTVSIFPNPVHKQFQLEYTVPERGRVLLVLFDNAGKKVANLVDRELEAGTYNESFNADDYSLSPGMYYVRSIISGESSSTSFVRQR